MEIIKRGELPEESKKFTCRLCKCVFIAKKGEYGRQNLQYSGIEYTCDCPECGAMCRVIE